MGVRLPFLNVQRIVGVFGDGPLGCSRACEEVGFTLPATTARHWVTRNSLPMNGFLMINRTHEIKRGRPLDINDFIEGQGQ